MISILAVTTHFLPGYKAGGPIRSLANLVDWLGDEFRFSILTSDRDLGDRRPFSEVLPGSWVRVGKASVCYLSPKEQSVAAWRRLLATLEYDLLYLNGCFSPLTVRTLILRRLGQIPDVPVVVAAQGQLSPGALTLKRLKKHLYLQMARICALYEGIVWQASSVAEAEDIAAVVGRCRGEDLGSVWSATTVEANPHIIVAPDLPPRQTTETGNELRPPKVPGTAHVVFLSRIARMKNLDLALRLIAQVTGTVWFSVYGPIEDRGYWRECEALMRAMPSNVQVRYEGTLAPSEVARVFLQHHLLFLPTRSENFGHAILEALSAGCPVLISDQTPWRKLADNEAGWDLALTDASGFRTALEQVIAWDDTAFSRWSRGAQRYAERYTSDSGAAQAMRELFLAAAGARS